MLINDIAPKTGKYDVYAGLYRGESTVLASDMCTRLLACLDGYKVKMIGNGNARAVIQKMGKILRVCTH